jgi:hypothetical protein
VSIVDLIFTFESLLSLTLELVKEGNSLSNLLIKFGEVIEISLNLINGQVNKHASDLGCSGWSNQLLNVLVDELSNKTLVVRILGNNGGKVTES